MRICRSCGNIEVFVDFSLTAGESPTDLISRVKVKQIRDSVIWYLKKRGVLPQSYDPNNPLNAIAHHAQKTGFTAEDVSEALTLVRDNLTDPSARAAFIFVVHERRISEFSRIRGAKAAGLLSLCEVMRQTARTQEIRIEELKNNPEEPTED